MSKVKALTAPTLQEADLKEELEAVKEVPGKERSGVLKNMVSYLKEKEGEDAPEKVIKEMNKLGYEVPSLEKTNQSEVNWEKRSVHVMFFITVGKLFNWKEEDYVGFGKYLMSLSVLTRLYFTLTPSQKSFADMASRFSSYVTQGEMELVKFDKKNKEAILHLKGIKSHPFLCSDIKGVIQKLAEMSLRSENITLKETKCPFNDKNKLSYHEYLLQW